jgi:hypothetical protein
MFYWSVVALAVETAESLAVAAERVDSLPSLYPSALRLVLAVFTPSRLVREVRAAARVLTRCSLMRPPLLLVDEAVVRHTRPMTVAVVGAVTATTVVSSERAVRVAKAATAAPASGTVLTTSPVVEVAGQAKTVLTEPMELQAHHHRPPTLVLAATAATVRPTTTGLAAGSLTEEEAAVAHVTALIT